MKKGHERGKLYFSVLVVIAFLIGGIAGIFAYSSSPYTDSVTPSQFGHSVDEMDWSKVIKGNVSADGFCIGTNCIKSWTEAGTSGTPTAPASLSCRISTMRYAPSGTMMYSNDQTVYCDREGEILTGGGCAMRPASGYNRYINQIESYPMNMSHWRCQVGVSGATSAESSVTPYAVCCKI